jgi:hypothetical protein
MRIRSLDHLVLTVSDIAATVHDPDGNLVELSHPSSLGS